MGFGAGGVLASVATGAGIGIFNESQQTPASASENSADREDINGIEVAISQGKVNITFVPDQTRELSSQDIGMANTNINGARAILEGLDKATTKNPDNLAPNTFAINAAEVLTNCSIEEIGEEAAGLYSLAFGSEVETAAREVETDVGFLELKFIPKTSGDAAEQLQATMNRANEVVGVLNEIGGELLNGPVDPDKADLVRMMSALIKSGSPEAIDQLRQYLHGHRKY